MVNAVIIAIAVAVADNVENNSGINKSCRSKYENTKTKKKQLVAARTRIDGYETLEASQANHQPEKRQHTVQISVERTITGHYM
ncbi:unnamed protein product [Sphenostylis stenocarpa]|uniref:Uncharacterized protein n=1 Tax=Sphenostylis stenocarpa TaxID=92480 RepID=A0AA86VQA7_9FABA|nr:unnamed protein product [Sphenostylis stenocarpa]